MSNHFIVYGRVEPYCKYCEEAKNLITLKKDTYEFHDIVKSEQALQDFRSEFPNAKTVPQILKGTFDDVVGWFWEPVGPLSELEKHYGIVR